MAEARKLTWTPARVAMLKAIAESGRPYFDHYQPARWLVKNGFAKVVEGKFSDRIEITDAGRAAQGEG